MQRRKLFNTLALAIGLALTAPVTLAHAEKPAVFVEAFQTAAAGGYDVTSFFSGTPVPGSAQITATHNGATYRFANAANHIRVVIHIVPPQTSVGHALSAIHLNQVVFVDSKDQWQMLLSSALRF
jgi:hypothetical protein